MTDAALATEAYLYGFALVFDVEQVTRSTTVGFGTIPAVPFNRFSHADKLAVPADDFRPMIRMYMPDEAVLAGTYQLPVIRRVG